MSEKHLLLAAGGTGGHIFPATALAACAQKEGHSTSLITDKRGLAFLTEQDKDRFDRIFVLKATHFDGPLSARFKAFMFFLAESTKVPRLIKKCRPDIVVGFGGFVSFWPVVWAFIKRFPLAIYQADAVLGRVNKLLSPFVQKITLGFAHTKGLKKSGQWVGFLTRPSFKRAPYPKRLTKDPFRLFVLGGSQGAAIFSQLIPKAIQLLEKDVQKNIHITQQCRPEYLADTKEAYQKTHATVVLETFIQDVPKVLKEAHLVISRAGTSTLGELATVGRPALLIPYPYATDQHQKVNAEHVVLEDGGWMQAQSKLTPSFLAHFLTQCLEAPQMLESKARHIQKLTPGNATSVLLKVLLSLLPASD
ncbi:MAG: UDP-N-acetylglucosamine--N-acetylmuramyl-(pentapeptide) pyrophosphoryl-undecaprenol N-acetylglucosamine transferase [Holosporaceae bacterium]